MYQPQRVCAALTSVSVLDSGRTTQAARAIGAAARSSDPGGVTISDSVCSDPPGSDPSCGTLQICVLSLHFTSSSNLYEVPPTP